MNPLADLLARVEAADGPDRELDARIWCAVETDDGVPTGAIFSHLVGGGEVAIYFLPNKPGSRRCPGWPAYTASLDAALALRQRIFPEGSIQLAIFPASTTCRLFPNEDSDGFKATRKTAPLALLASMLKAKLAEEKAP